VGIEALSEEDAEIRDRRNRQIREAQEQADFKRRTQVMQRGLPRSSAMDIDAMLMNAAAIQDPIKAAIAQEAALLEANDALRYPVSGAKVRGVSKPLDAFDDDALAQARLEITREVPAEIAQKGSELFQKAWEDAKTSSLLPGLSSYEDEVDEHEMLVEAFDVSSPSTIFVFSGM
jgi:pre-mRNA-splicing factor CDC5/CEF1